MQPRIGSRYSECNLDSIHASDHQHVIHKVDIKLNRLLASVRSLVCWLRNSRRRKWQNPKSEKKKKMIISTDSEYERRKCQCTDVFIFKFGRLNPCKLNVFATSKTSRNQNTEKCLSSPVFYEGWTCSIEQAVCLNSGAGRITIRLILCAPDDQRGLCRLPLVDFR